MIANVFEEISRSFRDYSGPSSLVIGVIILALGILLLAIVLARHFSTPGAQVSRLRRQFFRRVADANQLTLVERDLVLRIAQHYELDDPVLVFVKRSLFESAVTALKLDVGAVEAMRRKLYG